MKFKDLLNSPYFTLDDESDARCEIYYADNTAERFIADHEGNTINFIVRDEDSYYIKYDNENEQPFGFNDELELVVYKIAEVL